MKDQKIAENSTFYNYTLIKKISMTRSFIIFCLYFNIFLLACDVIYFRLDGLIAYLISIPAIALLQFILISIVLQTTNDSSRRHWGIRKGLPFVGYMPTGFVALKSLYRVHAHLLLVGSAIIGILYIWIPPAYFNSFMFVHLGLLLPRLVTLWRFKKLKPSGLVKFNEKDVSYYTT
ncbi:hypothetical protein EHS13_01355 [Paenibacillus psychroresistens]|uniref:Uncharacterized protein n=1 Tax=Paenibacillus psychroresistens TaxID=1778678 RepID=A0A6B8RC54_9BACL|nr:hypothetical protein [Paenibacillus psychroresistens]QGQ93657.1 hypothetical protein EHS13_01355 [Paenibacillus psychroresistens]